MNSIKHIYSKPSIILVNIEDIMFSPDAVSGEEIPTNPDLPDVQDSNLLIWGNVWYDEE